MPAEKKQSTRLTLDFTGVEDRRGGGPSIRVESGDYLLKVVNAEVRKKSGADSKYVSWQHEIVKGPELKKGAIYHITSLKEESLWSIRNYLMDLLGKEIPKRALTIDVAKYKGKLIGATVDDDDPYTDPESGKTSIKSKIVGTFPAGDYQDVATTPAKAAKKKVVEEVDEEEEETEDLDEDEATDAVTSDDEEDLEELDVDDL